MAYLVTILKALTKTNQPFTKEQRGGCGWCWTRESWRWCSWYVNLDTVKITPGSTFCTVGIFKKNSLIEANWSKSDSTSVYPAVTYAAAENQGRLFSITCKWLKLLRKTGRLQLIQNWAPSVAGRHQCCIGIV